MPHPFWQTRMYLRALRFYSARTYRETQETQGQTERFLRTLRTDGTFTAFCELELGVRPVCPQVSPPESQSSIKYSLLWRRLDRLLFSLDGK